MINKLQLRLQGRIMQKRSIIYIVYDVISLYRKLIYHPKQNLGILSEE